MSGATDYRLIVRTPGGQAHEYPLVHDYTSIGRDSGSNLVLDSRFVSRLHASIRRAGDGFAVVDEGSTNGLLLNGKRLAGQQLLSEGDRLEIADVTLDFTGKSLGLTTITPLLAGKHGSQFRCDSATWEVWLAGNKVDVRLSVQEFELLSALALEPGQIVSRARLGDAIWGPANYDHNMLHQLVHRLRDKLGAEHHELIESVPGVGYRIRET